MGLEFVNEATRHDVLWYLAIMSWRDQRNGVNAKTDTVRPS